MLTRIQLRRDTATGWSTVNTVLQAGEPALDETNGILKIGDGVTPWASLPVFATAVRAEDTDLSAIYAARDDALDAAAAAAASAAGRTATTAALAAIGDPINTANKTLGAQVWNSSTHKPVYAAGSAAGDIWYDATGATAHTPV